MSLFLILAFLFFIGSVAGWVMELLFRRFFSDTNKERKWINPGFCTGPYLPLYGFGLCLLYLIAGLENSVSILSSSFGKLLLFAIMAVAMTAIEYIAGIVVLKLSRVRLWDYSNERWNVQGIICPKFSLIWAVLGAMYYFLIHNRILEALDWLSQNLAFSFVIGLFFGVFIIDVVNSTQLMAKLKKFADENDVVVRYEAIKSHIRQLHEQSQKKYNFFRPFRYERPMSELLKDLHNSFEKYKKNLKK